MYEVKLGGKVVGYAQVDTEGLYYCIRCRCRLSGEVVYKVIVQSGEHSLDLGILVPENGAFVLTARVPKKRFGEDNLQFCAVPRHVTPGNMFVPISPEEPFAYLSRLTDAYMQVRNGVAGIVIKTEETI